MCGSQNHVVLLNVYFCSCLLNQFVTVKLFINSIYFRNSCGFWFICTNWILVALETLYFPEYQEVKYLKRNLNVTVRPYIKWLLMHFPESNGLNSFLKNSPRVILVLSFFPARLISSSSLWHQFTALVSAWKPIGVIYFKAHSLTWTPVFTQRRRRRCIELWVTEIG